MALALRLLSRLRSPRRARSSRTWCLDDIVGDPVATEAAPVEAVERRQQTWGCSVPSPRPVLGVSSLPRSVRIRRPGLAAQFLGARRFLAHRCNAVRPTGSVTALDINLPFLADISDSVVARHQK